jgi:hypothetical protein
VIADLGLVKTFLRIPREDTTGDELLSLLLLGVDAGVKGFLKRDVESQDYTEFYNGSGVPELVLRQRPVTLVSKVYFDMTGYYGKGRNAFPESSLLVEGEDFVLRRENGTASNSGIMYRTSGGTVGGAHSAWPGWWADFRRGTLSVKLPPVWARGVGNIKVVYTAGYLPGQIPADLVKATLELLAFIRSASPIGTPVNSPDFAEMVTKLLTQGSQGEPLIGTIREVLRRHSEIVI